MNEQERVIVQEAEVAPASQDDGKKRAVYRTYNSIWFLIGAIETLLGLRLLFLLLGANPSNGITQLIYGLSYPFAEPFRNLFGMTAVGNTVFDWSLLVAGLIYLLIGYGLIQLLRIVRPLNREETNQKLNAV